MSEPPERLELAPASRRRAAVVSAMRGLSRGTGAPPVLAAAAEVLGGPAGLELDGEACDLCGTPLAERHRHLLHLVERRIECACESCWNTRSGDPEYRPAGNRTLWLPDLSLPDELWASLQIPIGLTFFMESTVTGSVVALYPSPGGATESELHLDSWRRLCELNPVLETLEPDVEGLVVNRLPEQPEYAIAPIDRCYALAGMIKRTWSGISGGTALEAAVGRFFADMRAEGARA